MEHSRAEQDPNYDGKINGLFCDDRFPEPASAIRIARLYNIPDILPAAYYELFSIDDVQHDWDGLRKPDAEHSLHLQNLGRTARWQLLDAADLIRLIRMQQKFCEIESSAKSDFASIAECTVPQCARNRQAIKTSLFGSSDWKIGMAVLVVISQKRRACKYMCGVCGPIYDSKLQKISTKIWDSIVAISAPRSVSKHFDAVGPS